jgi:DNA-binding response OmpR family regulator
MSRSILLIEDEPGLVLTLKDRLTREGYEVDAAQDGNLGLAAAMRGQADLIILDLMLPGRSGLDAVWRRKPAAARSCSRTACYSGKKKPRCGAS